MGSPKTDLFPPVTFRGPQHCLVSPCHVLGSPNAALCVFITFWGPLMRSSVPSGWPGVPQQSPVIVFCRVVGSPKLSYVPESPNAVLCPLKVPQSCSMFPWGVLGFPDTVLSSFVTSCGPQAVPCPRVPQHSPISPQCPPTLSHLPSLDSGVPQHCSVSLRGVLRSPHSVVFPLSCPGDPHSVLCVCVPSCPRIPQCHLASPHRILVSLVMSRVSQQRFVTLIMSWGPPVPFCHCSCVPMSLGLILSPLLCPQTRSCHPSCVLVSPNLILSPVLYPQISSCHPSCVPGPNIVTTVTSWCPQT